MNDIGTDANPLSVGDASEASVLWDRVGTALQSLGDYVGARQLISQGLESALRNLGTSEGRPAYSTRSFARSRSLSRYDSIALGDRVGMQLAL